MRKDNIIKKIKHGLKFALVAGIISLSLTSCGPNLENYTTQEDIISNAETLDCDMTYVRTYDDDFLRMKHNNGDPIYVCFDKEYSEELKEQAKKSLDYIFGIVGKINNNYHYEIVDKFEFDLKINKTKIYYTFGEHVSTYEDHSSIANAHLESHTPNSNKNTDKPIMNYFELNLNKDYVNNNNSNDYNYSFEYTLNHELLHAFGLDDVYTTLINQTTKKYYGNTYMLTSTEFKKITPNDLACLISLYADENCDMEKMKAELLKYELKFYKEYANQCKEKFETEEDFVEESFNFQTGVLIEKEDKTMIGYDYKVTVEEGKYKFEIYDHYSNELLDSYSGEAVSQNGTIILKNIELKHGMRPNGPYDYYEDGFVQDFIFLSKNGKSYLYDFNSNCEYFGFINTFEKSLTN